MTPRKILLVPILAIGLGALATPVLAEGTEHAEASRSANVGISFVNHGGIRDWRSHGDSTIYLQDRGRQWYEVTLMSPSFELPFTWAIGFDAGPNDRFDKFSSVVIGDRKIPVQSMVRIDAPPKHQVEPERG